MNKFLKFLNNIPGRGCCPNCEVNWFYIGDKNTTTIWYTAHNGVLICKKCASKPEKLYPDKICNNLAKTGWPLYEVEIIKNMIIKMIPIKDIRKQKLQKILKIK